MRITLCVLLCVLFATASFADVVHLKNGKEVSGKIKEQDDDAVKIETFGVSLTYWRDEIDHIESEGGLTEKRVASGTTPKETYLAYLSILEKSSTPEELLENSKAYISEEKYGEGKEMFASEDQEANIGAFTFLKAMTPKDVVVIDVSAKDDTAILTAEGTSVLGRGRGIIQMKHIDGQWKIISEQWKAGDKVKLQTTEPVRRGFGSFSGTISLPALEEIPQESRLFVAAGKFGELQTSVYKEIPMRTENVKTVSYTLDSVPVGKYWAYVVWDVAKPYIGSPEKTFQEMKDSGFAMQQNPASLIVAYDNDYKQSLTPLEFIDIKGGEHVQGVDFETLKKVRWIEVLGPKETDYALSNIQLSQDEANEYICTVDITNNGTEDVGTVNLSVYINGHMTNSFRGGTGFIKPGETHTYDFASEDTLHGYYIHGWNMNKPKDKLMIHLISKENGSHASQLLSIPSAIVDRLSQVDQSSNYEKTISSWDPRPWGAPYNVIDIVKEDKNDGTANFFLKLKNISDQPIDGIQLCININGKHSNLSNSGSEYISPHGEKLVDITFFTEEFQEGEERVDTLNFIVIGEENNIFFQKTFSL